MLLNYLKLSIRLMMRNPFFTFVNVFGLSIGFTSFFALWQYSSTELKADQHHKDFDRIARVGIKWQGIEKENPGIIMMGVSKASIPPLIKNDFPEIESYVRILEQGGFFQNDLVSDHGVKIVISPKIRAGHNNVFRENRIAYADKNIFEFFTIPLLEGEKKSVLSGVNFVALSKSTARKYFGELSPLGEELSLNDSITLLVTGVFEDMPHQSRLNYDLIISNEGLLTKWSNVYWGGTVNFIKLAKGSSFKSLEEKINGSLQKYWGNFLKTCGCNLTMFVQPLTEITFTTGIIGDEGMYRPSRNMLITFGIVSIVIVGMAWINFINLSIARLNTRVKEFATRRANGAVWKDLVKQFLVESLLINVLGVGLSVTFLQIIRRPLALFFEIHLEDVWSTDAKALIPLTLIVCGGIVVTALYPAFICIMRNGRNLFKQHSGGSAKSQVTAFLTTAQFATAIVLIAWVFIIYLQLDYILKKDIGLEREGIVIIEGPIVRPVNYSERVETFIKQLKSEQNFEDVTFSRYMLGDMDGDKPGNLTITGTSIGAGGNCNGINDNFIPFFGLKVIAGRNFVADDRSDAIIITRKVAKGLGFNNEASALGVKVNVNTGNWTTSKEADIIGVIEDYRVTSFLNFAGYNSETAEGGGGSFFTYKNKLFPELTPDKIALKVGVNGAEKSIAAVEKLFMQSFPGNPFEWSFLDDRINRIYSSEKTTRNQILLFTIVAIGISCLGLIAMMTQAIGEKTKEIGIRKILGARAFQIGRLLLDSLLFQFILAGVVAIPIAYYLGNEYLNRYSDRTSIVWWHYVAPLVLLLTLMLLAVSSMLLKAAKANPVDALKYE